MTASQKTPRRKPSAFAVALTSALLVPAFGLLFMLLIFATAPQGPEGLVVLVGIIGFIISIPFAGVLLLIIAATNGISNRARKKRAQVENEPLEAGAEQAKPAASEAKTPAVPNGIYVVVTALASAPLLASVFVLLSLLTIHTSTPNQNEADVRQKMAASLTDVGYKSLPGYHSQAADLTVSPHQVSSGTTTYLASLSATYNDAKAISNARKRLEATGWTCKTSRTAPIARASTTAATGSDALNTSCSKAGREVLNFTYVSPTRALLSASTDGDAELSTLDDYGWCKSYGEIQKDELSVKCQNILGENPKVEAEKQGLSKECYDIVYGFDSDKASKDLLARCAKEFQKN